jgi:hypothetical protein
MTTRTRPGAVAMPLHHAVVWRSIAAIDRYGQLLAVQARLPPGFVAQQPFLEDTNASAE